VVFQPIALAPEHQPNALAGGDLLRRKLRRSAGIDHRLGLIVRARRGGKHDIQITDRRFGRLEHLHAVEHTVRAGRHHVGALGRPPAFRRNQPQPRQPEIRHRARRRADIVGKLRLDQDHARPRLLNPSFGLVGPGAGHAASP